MIQRRAGPKRKSNGHRQRRFSSGRRRRDGQKSQRWGEAIIAAASVLWGRSRALATDTRPLFTSLSSAGEAFGSSPPTTSSGPAAAQAVARSTRSHQFSSPYRNLADPLRRARKVHQPWSPSICSMLRFDATSSGRVRDRSFSLQQNSHPLSRRYLVSGAMRASLDRTGVFLTQSGSRIRSWRRISRKIENSRVRSQKPSPPRSLRERDA